MGFPRIFVSELPRTTPRAVWLVLYRQLRLHESFNGATQAEFYRDSLIYGTAFCRYEMVSIKTLYPKAPEEQIAKLIYPLS